MTISGLARIPIYIQQKLNFPQSSGQLRFDHTPASNDLIESPNDKNTIDNDNITHGNNNA